MENNIKLFTVGPAQMYQHTLDVRSKMVPYFRTSEFSNIMLDNCEMLKETMNAPKDAEVIFLTASGSGAMEATVINCFDENDKLLVISGGTFGERFEYICKLHRIPYVALKLGKDEQLTKQHLIKYNEQGFTGLLVNLHETYTGQLYDIKIIHEFCQKNKLFLVVDAISTFLCDPYDMEKYNIDATIISSQKGLCLAPGLSAVVLGKRIIEKKVITNQTKTMYFDFKDYLNNIHRGQTPFTPCVGVLFELNDMLRFIKEQGTENRIKEVKERCDYFRNRISELPVHLPSFPLSNAITPIRFEKNIAKEFFEYLKNEKNIMVNPVGGELGNCSIRVAHIGDLDYEDYDILIDEMKDFFDL
ncbi:pyridoxal-phosphate-dependent aminotransferase family protein [[Clostridium] scindens]|uniref:pyridoxal-phosphate-dependent aminotransferase family protein n=1 Tax=Clostridium scindens (strain JCM 10418 / VPI 12708) TaxID=29347 RepID=UPI001E45BFF3|nr:aminotransferase class V-fold PLP-dependent enzyme [[Clostridium] scindens]